MNTDDISDSEREELLADLRTCKTADYYPPVVSPTPYEQFCAYRDNQECSQCRTKMNGSWREGRTCAKCEYTQEPAPELVQLGVTIEKLIAWDAIKTVGGKFPDGWQTCRERCKSLGIPLSEYTDYYVGVIQRELRGRDVNAYLSTVHQLTLEQAYALSLVEFAAKFRTGGDDD
jgi:hypothetical protein